MLASGVWKLCYSSFTSSPLKGILRSTWMKLRTMLDPLILSCLFALIQTYAICLGSMSGNSLSDICLVLVARRALGRKKEARRPACQWSSVPWYEGSGWWRNQPDSTTAAICINTDQAPRAGSSLRSSGAADGYSTAYPTNPPNLH